MEAGNYEPVIEFISVDVVTLAFSTSRRTMVHRNIGTWSRQMLTVFELTSGLHNLSCRHLYHLLNQAIQLLEIVVNICPSQ